MTQTSTTEAPHSSAGDRDLSAVSVTDFLRFYENRGYGEHTTFGARAALVIVDFSVAFTRGVPGFPTTNYEAEIARTQRLLAGVRGLMPVFFTTIAYKADMSDAGLWSAKIPWLAELQEGTPGVAIDARLSPLSDEPVIVKKYPSSFFGTDLEDRLRQHDVDTLLIAGCTMSCCVRATAIDAMQLGFHPFLIHDAIGELTPALRAIHFADIRSRYASAASVEDVIAHLERNRSS
jgi:nicotinamidase-related amidase